MVRWWLTQEFLSRNFGWTSKMIQIKTADFWFRLKPSSRIFVFSSPDTLHNYPSIDTWDWMDRIRNAPLWKLPYPPENRCLLDFNFLLGVGNLSGRRTFIYNRWMGSLQQAHGEFWEFFFEVECDVFFCVPPQQEKLDLWIYSSPQPRIPPGLA